MRYLYEQRRRLSYIRTRINLYVKSRVLHTEPILVYQVGKVGSSSIASAIDHLPGYHTIHVHRLNPDRIKAAQSAYRASNHYIRDMRLESYLSREILQYPGRWKIVTGVRNPFEQCVSSFYQNFRRATGCSFDNYHGSLAELQDIFFSWPVIDEAIHWFDWELKTVTGIDVYSKPFDFENGFNLYGNDRFDVLLLKAETSNEKKAKAVKSFLGCDALFLSSENSAACKPYFESYTAFKTSLTFPEHIVKRFLSSKLLYHFYTKPEIAHMTEKY